MLKRLLRIGQREQHGIVGALAIDHAAQRVHPFVQLLATLLGWKRGIVGDVVGVAHEGVHRRQRVALAQQAEPGSRNRSSWRPSGRCAGKHCRPPAIAAGARSQQFSHRRARHQPQLARLGDGRTPLQHVVALLLDGVENLQAAAAEQVESMARCLSTLSTSGRPRSEPVARPRHFELHHLEELRGGAALGDVAAR